MDLSEAAWRKSSRSSGGGNGDCVEVADLGTAVALRDSKDSTGPVLVFTPCKWRTFLGSVKAGWRDR